MKKYIISIFSIIILFLCVYIFFTPKYSEDQLNEIKGSVNETYKIKEDSLNIINTSPVSINEKKILIMYSKYQQGILEVFQDGKKSKKHASEYRLVLVCAELLFSNEKSKILDQIFSSVFNTSERQKAQIEYINHLKGQRYPNLMTDPKIKQKCEKIY